MTIDTLRDHEFQQSYQSRIECVHCGLILDLRFEDRVKYTSCPGPRRTMQYREERTITGEVLRIPIGYR